MFSLSRGLRDLLCLRHKIGKQGYAVRGTIEEDEVRAFCVEESVVYDDFVRSKATVENLYRYPQLFVVTDTG
jgi:hypothetical protein